jgi:hypothetical protein
VVRKERHLLLTLAPEQVSPNLKQHPEMRAGSGYGLIVRWQWQNYPTLFRHQKTRFRCQSISHAEPLQAGFPFICVILWDGRYGTEGRTVRHGRHGTDGTVRKVRRYGTDGTDGSTLKPVYWKPSGWLRPPVGVKKPNRSRASGDRMAASMASRKEHQDK